MNYELALLNAKVEQDVSPERGCSEGGPYRTPSISPSATVQGG